MAIVKAFWTDTRNAWVNAPNWWDRVKTVTLSLAIICVAAVVIEGFVGNVILGNGPSGGRSSDCSGGLAFPDGPAYEECVSRMEDADLSDY